MKIKYELNNAHICHNNVNFKIPSVLVKNLTDKVIDEMPYIYIYIYIISLRNAYHFLLNTYENWWNAFE